MGGLSDAFISFKTRYNTVESKDANYDEFVLELDRIIDQLMICLDKEDNELYPLEANLICTSIW